MIDRLRADAQRGTGRRSPVFVAVVVAAGLFAILYPWFAGTPNFAAGSVAPYTLNETTRSTSPLTDATTSSTTTPASASEAPTR